MQPPGHQFQDQFPRSSVMQSQQQMPLPHCMPQPPQPMPMQQQMPQQPRPPQQMPPQQMPPQQMPPQQMPPQRQMPQQMQQQMVNAAAEAARTLPTDWRWEAAPTPATPRNSLAKT